MCLRKDNGKPILSEKYTAIIRGSLVEIIQYFYLHHKIVIIYQLRSDSHKYKSKTYYDLNMSVVYVNAIDMIIS